MSSSSPDPELSVVVACNGAAGAVAACLAALEPQLDGAEVLVCEPAPSSETLRRRFPWARFHQRSGALVPELWRDGIERSRGRIVALTISPMQPAPDWVAEIRRLHERVDAVGGAIDPGSGLRVSDWAEYFCRYARDMLPFEGHECLDLPGDNAAYKRELLDRVRELTRNGFWEPVVNRRLQAQGATLWHAPELVVRQGRSAGARAFARQRLVHGRAYGRQRGAGFGVARNAAGIAAVPLVPLLLTSRLAREVLRKRRHRGRLLLALPLVLAFNVSWAAGEALGHLDVLRGR
jgi:hypothetical protein